MLCPNCNQPLHYVNADNQHILHCSNCGSSFFEENGINRISQETAQKLYDDRQTDEISGVRKVCPKDQSILDLIEPNQAVLSNVSLFRCPHCHGIFAYGEDLVSFKNSQNLNIGFYKAMNKPLPALRAVMVMSLVFVFSILSLTWIFSNGSVQKSQAKDLINNVTLTTSGHYIMFYFKTKTPFESKIIFTNTETKEIIEKTVSQIPTTTHQLTTGDIDYAKNLQYQIVLIDSQGNEIKTEMRKINIK